MLDSIQPGEDYIPLSGESEPSQRKTQKGAKTQKRVVVLLILISVCGFISLIGNKTGIIKKFAPNVPVSESPETIENMGVKTPEQSETQTDNNTGEFQPSPDLEMLRDEQLEKALGEVGFQVNNLSEAVAEDFLLQAKQAIEKEPISIELFLIKKLNYLCNKLDKAVLDGEFSGSAKEREKAASLLFEVWGNLSALQKHWDSTAGNQIQIKFTSVNVSVLASNVRDFSTTAMNLRMLTYEQQKRVEALQKQLELEAQKQAVQEGKK